MRKAGLTPRYEAAYRALQLTKTRGVLRMTGPACYDYHLNETYVITHYPGRRVTVYRKTAFGGPVLGLDLTNGVLAGNHNPHLLLDALRQAMVLDDLAEI